jgi:uncharacterized protein (TIGR03435 family)
LADPSFSDSSIFEAQRMNRLVFFVLCGFGVALAAQQAAPPFEVASIKRNTDPRPPGSGPVRTPKGEIRVVAVLARLLVLYAYPLDAAPAEVVGVPSWANSERYDITVKGIPDATPEQATRVWRTLLADRMKLAAHYEPREVRGYHLVVARSDGRLGPELKPSTLDCPEPNPTRPAASLPEELRSVPRSGVVTKEREGLLMSQCRWTMREGNTTYAGAVNMAALVAALRRGGIREPIEDHTGLEGLYAFKLTFLPQTLKPQTTDIDTGPSIFTAIQEQLGLKLEPALIRSQVVVVDRMERPTEN